MKTTKVRVKATGEVVEINAEAVQSVDRLGFISHKWVSAEPGDRREFEDEEIEWID